MEIVSRVFDIFRHDDETDGSNPTAPSSPGVTEAHVDTTWGRRIIISRRKSLLDDQTSVIDLDFTDLIGDREREVVISLGPHTFEKFMAALNAVGYDERGRLR